MAFNSYMHERNIYRNQPDFTKIALDFPAFRKYAIPDAKGKKVRVDFTNPEALRMVTEILLKKDFNLDVEIPKGFLIPTVPQRLNYILWLEDLLTKVPIKKQSINGIDIGTGPCAIFSILGARKNNWNFIATENCEDAIQWAKKNIIKNNLESKIKVVKTTIGTTLSEILSSNEDSYDFCLCNPPFFGDIEEIRKKNPNSNCTIADLAREKEIFYEGGEFSFVKNILNDSLIYKDRVCIFTSMCGKKKSFLEILKEIEEIKEAKVTTTEFCQGNTVRWGIAWTFNKSIEFDEVKRKLKPKKVKPPLEYQIPIKNSKGFNLKILVDETEAFLKSLKIPHKITKSSQYYAEFLMKSDENTWTHQRRKRREMQRQKKETNDVETESHVSIKKEIIGDSDTMSEDKNGSTFEINDLKMEPCVSIKKEPIDDSETMANDSAVNSETLKLNIKNSPEKNHKDLDTKPDCLNNISDEILPQSQKIDIHNPLSKEDKSIEFDDLTKVASIGSEVTDRSSSNCTNTISENENVQDMFLNKNRKRGNEEKSPVSKKIRLNIESKNPECLEKLSELKIESMFTRIESKTDIPEIKLDIGELNKSQNLFSGDNVKKLTSESNTLPNENTSKQNDQDQSVVKIETDLNSIDNENKICIKVEVDEDSIRDDTNIDSGEKIKDIQTQEGSMLFCHLQLIKGKGKVYVKMNCPPTADRNTMYQVFQLIKNKIK